ncbi:MAG: NADH-quinone oxidoreductase subunit NuoE [Anaerolineaceae bacterium]|nr:NADH-quinone oxidoreductase subunit NuoE [Anaerolineaceae bacterium]
MTIVKENEQRMLDAVEKAIQQHGDSRDELIPILTDVNRTLGYLPSEALEEISRKLKSPRSQLFSVASFYHMLSTKPRGKHVIQFCESAPCHVVGGREVWQALQDTLQLDSGETSEDGKWTLITTSCLGLCGVGPVVVIDDDAYGNLTAEQIPAILERYND